MECQSKPLLFLLVEIEKDSLLITKVVSSGLGTCSKSVENEQNVRFYCFGEIKKDVYGSFLSLGNICTYNTLTLLL